MDKTARDIADGELGYLSKTTSSYCECRWPKWHILLANTPPRSYLYCQTCHKTASPLVYELIDDGKSGDSDEQRYKRALDYISRQSDWNESLAEIASAALVPEEYPDHWVND